MLRRIRACAALAVLMAAAHVSAETVRFPTIETADLNGAPITLPTGLPGERTLVIIGFAREQQATIDTWVEGLALKTGALAWLELPVIDNPGPIGRFAIDTGMRSGVPRGDRSHVVTLYTDKAAFKAALGITSEAAIVTAVIDRTGAVLARATGPYDAAAGEALKAQLR